jgi:MFS family permease
MGIWTICIGTSPYIALIVDGFVTTYAGWRWMQWLTFFVWAALIIPCATLLPETLYHRSYNLDVIPAKETYFQQLKWKHLGAKFHLEPFARPLVLLKYPSVLFPVFWYGNLYGFCVFGGLGILPFVSSLQDLSVLDLNNPEKGFHAELRLRSRWPRSCWCCPACGNALGRALGRASLRLDRALYGATQWWYPSS